MAGSAAFGVIFHTLDLQHIGSVPGLFPRIARFIQRTLRVPSVPGNLNGSELLGQPGEEGSHDVRRATYGIRHTFPRCMFHVKRETGIGTRASVSGASCPVTALHVHPDSHVNRSGLHRCSQTVHGQMGELGASGQYGLTVTYLPRRERYTAANGSEATARTR